MARQNQFPQLMAYFFAGVVGLFVYYACFFFFEGNVELSLGEVAIVACLGGIVVAIGEAMSWLVTSRWLKGIVFGLAVGIGGGLINFWFYETTLEQSIASFCVGGLVGGLIFKLLSPRAF